MSWSSRSAVCAAFSASRQSRSNLRLLCVGDRTRMRGLPPSLMTRRCGKPRVQELAGSHPVSGEQWYCGNPQGRGWSWPDTGDGSGSATLTRLPGTTATLHTHKLTFSNCLKPLSSCCWARRPSCKCCEKRSNRLRSRQGPSRRPKEETTYHLSLLFHLL